LWEHFDALRKIPRPSKREERARAYVLSVAERQRLLARTDSAGNVVIALPATPRREGAPGVVLQSHLDMVCEKDAAKAFDFFTDPIELVLDGDRLRANGTTLGADNGVGVAAALMMTADGAPPHGPLELLFTVDEETGLNGARGLDPSLLAGRLLVNLDSEEDGTITIGCAGGKHTEFRIPLAREAPNPSDDRKQALEIRVSGLSGGHSGMEIHKGRANAIKLLAGALRRLSRFDLVGLEGGNAHNAIPREATAFGWGEEAEIRATVSAYLEACTNQYRSAEPGLRIDVAPAIGLETPRIGSLSAAALVDLLIRLPHGEIARSRTFPDLVETSANVATVRTEEDHGRVLVSWRSSVERSLAEVVARGELVGREQGAEATTGEGYPPWEPNASSRLLRTASLVYENAFGEKPHVAAVHAGLECAIIGHRIPSMEMISIGPTIELPHSPSENVSVRSVTKMFGTFLPALLDHVSRETG